MSFDDHMYNYYIPTLLYTLRQQQPQQQLPPAGQQSQHHSTSVLPAGNSFIYNSEHV